MYVRCSVLVCIQYLNICCDCESLNSLSKRTDSVKHTYMNMNSVFERLIIALYCVHMRSRFNFIIVVVW